jgi:ABC-2 type transport system permease protein
VTLPEPGASRAAAGNPVLPDGIIRFIEKTFVMAELEIRKLSHDASELVTRAIQPAKWLLVFGQVFTQTRAIPTGNFRYIDFMVPGILAQSVLFVSIF